MKKEELKEKIGPELYRLFEGAGILGADDKTGHLGIKVERDLNPLRDIFDIPVWRKKETKEGITYYLYI